MLSSLRTFVGSWAAKLLLILLVGSFALWGISGSLLGQGDLNTVATIGETKVPVADFLSAYQRNLNQTQQQVGRRLTRDQARTFGVEQRSLNDVIAFGTLDEYARRAGLSLSDETLAKMIASNETFQDSTGNFNRDTFRRAVFEAQMRESDFVDAQNASAIRSQLTKGFATGEILPDAFAEALRAYAAEERTFEFITVTPRVAGSIAQPTDAELDTYFQANTAKYAAPEFRKVTLLEVQPDALADPAAVTEEEVKADFEANIDTYRVAEQRRVQQVVFADQAKADAAAAQLAEGRLYETVMQEAGLTPTALGLVTQAQLPEAIGKAAFAAELNTPTGVVEGPFGPTILRVSEVQAPSETPLSEVDADIRKRLALRAASERLGPLQEEIEDARAGGASLSDVATRFKLQAREIPAIDRQALDADGEPVANLPVSRTLIERIFSARVGEQSSAMDAGNTGYVWFDVDAITEARDRTLDEVRERAMADWIAEEQIKRVETKAEELLAKFNAGTTMSALAADIAQPLATTTPMRRNGEVDSFPRAAVRKGFEGDAKLSFIAEGGQPDHRIVARVLTLTPAAADAVPQEQVDLANQGAADDLLNQLITKLLEDYTVTQNTTVIDYALTRN